MPRSTLSARRFVGGLGLAQICSWGSLYYSFPLIAQAMEADLGWTKPQLYGAATLGMVIAGLVSYPVGQAIDRGRGRAIMTGASVLAGLLMLAWSQVGSVAAFLVLASLVGGLQAATLYEPAFAVIAWRQGPAHARAAITELTLWGGFASTVFVPLVQWQIDTVGWRTALVQLGLVNIVACGGLYWAAIGPAGGHASARRDPPPGGAATPGAVRTALRTPAFWALSLALLAYATAFSAFTIHLYPMLLGFGLGARDVVLAMTVIGPAQVAGRIAVAWLAAHRSVTAIGSVVVASFPLILLALATLPTTLAVAIGTMLAYGAANGIFTIVRGMVVPEMVASTDYGAINGAMNGPSTFARALAPVGAAWLWSATGSYQAVLWATLAGTLVLAASFWAAAHLSRRARRAHAHS